MGYIYFIIIILTILWAFHRVKHRNSGYQKFEYYLNGEVNDVSGLTRKEDGMEEKERVQVDIGTIFGINNLFVLINEWQLKGINKLKFVYDYNTEYIYLVGYIDHLGINPHPQKA
jgi:hypothetical protein